MTKLTRPFRIYKYNPAGPHSNAWCWVLHCRWCGTKEQCEDLDDAIDVMSVHANWFHRNLTIENGVVTVNYPMAGGLVSG